MEAQSGAKQVLESVKVSYMFVCRKEKEKKEKGSSLEVSPRKHSPAESFRGG